MHILFVCTGNICRSPTAELLTRAWAEETLPDPQLLTTSSAGVYALVGRRMEPTAGMVLLGLGGDPSLFIAQSVSPELVSAADLIVTMTRGHRSAVLNNSPRALPRTFTLREAAALIPAAIAATPNIPPGLDERGWRLVAAMSRQRAIRADTAGQRDDVADPIGQSQAVFEHVGDDIAAALIPLLAALCGTDAPEASAEPVTVERSAAP